MEILDPDLWNDDGTPKRPSQEYMKNLERAQAGDKGVFMNYAQIKQQTRAQRPPEVGDMVHFWDEQAVTCRAAIVMEIESFGHGACVRVHIPHEPFQDWQCNHDEGKKVEHLPSWHWPCGEGQ